MSTFSEHIQSGYTCKGAYITLGAAKADGVVAPDAHIHIPLKTMNRHGLVAGATGTGKTKTLQVIAEQLSQKGVSVLMMDIKGDVSGLAAEGTMNGFIQERHNAINLPWKPSAAPLELMSLSNLPGTRLRATVSEFGPVLLAKVLQLNDTQAGVLSLLFKYADDNQLPLVDLKDLRKLIQFAIEEGKNEIKNQYGLISTASASAILRSITTLEQQDASFFFGEPSFDVDDLVRINDNGYGVISVVQLMDMQDKPALFSTFMLCLLAELYQKFPEEGDLEQPKLCIFIDEAHLIFQEASKSLLQQIETIIKLIRSKGVGIYFCTQNPQDIPDAVLSQLGLKVQHALRAFTEKDRKAIKKASENYPLSDYYKTDQLLTALGIGEALVTALNEKGIPTPLAHVVMRSPESRMDILSEAENAAIIKNSKLAPKYNQEIDRESAFEILTARLKAHAELEAEENVTPSNKSDSSSKKSSTKEEKSVIEQMSKNTMVRQLGNTVLREVTRGLFGVLGLKTTKSRKKSSFF